MTSSMMHGFTDELVKVGGIAGRYGRLWKTYDKLFARAQKFRKGNVPPDLAARLRKIEAETQRTGRKLRYRHKVQTGAAPKPA